MRNQSEIHCFIIWKNARDLQDRIINDLQNRFVLKKAYEIVWSDQYFSQNMSRFYGQRLPDRSFKEQHCGKGSFILAIVEDDKPYYDRRKTSHGISVVNINTFDKKNLYRGWTGGGHRIHATDTVKETDHDLTLLLGRNGEDIIKELPDVWDGTIEKLERDLTGAGSWNSIRELLYVLNNCVNYVILRNFEGFPEKYTLESHGDIDILCSNPVDTRYLLNAFPAFPGTQRVLHYSMLKDIKLFFDIRYTGDNYYDIEWEKSILINRMFDSNGFYKPDNRNYFYSLLYHALVHKPEFAPDYRKRLTSLAEDEGVLLPEDFLKETSHLNAIMRSFMKRKGYKYREPDDVSVFLNRLNSEIDKISLQRIFATSGNIAVAIQQILKQAKDSSVNSNEFTKPEFLSSGVLRRHFSWYRHIPVKVADLDKGSRVIELNAESGVITRYLGEEFSVVVALEKDPDLAKAAKIRCMELENVKVITTQHFLPEHKNKFDVAVLIEECSIKNEHLSKINIRKKIKEASEYLKDDGILLLGIENSESEFSPSKVGFTKKELEQLLSIYGFNKNCFIYSFPNHLFGQTFISQEGVDLKDPRVGLWAGSVNFTDKRNNLCNDLSMLGNISSMASEGKLDRNANSFIVIAGKAELIRPQWLIKSYNGEMRRVEARTETTLTRHGNSFCVCKNGRVFETETFLFNPVSSTPFYNGETHEKILVDRLLQRNIFGFVVELGNYCRFLIDNYSSDVSLPELAGKNDFYINGDMFDLLSRNIIVSKRRWNIFDLEWRYKMPLPLSFICFRNLLNIFNRYKINEIKDKFETHIRNSEVGVKEIIIDIMNRLPYFGQMNQRLLVFYLDFEKYFYSFVMDINIKNRAFLDCFIKAFYYQMNGDNMRLAETITFMKQNYPNLPETERLSLLLDPAYEINTNSKKTVTVN